MLTAQVELLRDMLPDIKGLLPLHWNELALNKDKVPLKPDYDRYIALEELGIMCTVVLRENGVAIGYVIGLISPHLHYMSCLTYIMDILYVSPDKRQSTGGMKLMTTLLKELKRRGVQRAVFNTKVHHNISPLFIKFGGKHIEEIYSIWLGD